MSDETKRMLPPPPPVRTKMKDSNKPVTGRRVWRALCNIDAGHAKYAKGDVLPSPEELDPQGILKEGQHFERGFELLPEESE